MTSRRYEHYRRAVARIEWMESEGISPEYRDVLREIAQDHLLSRGTGREAAEELDTDAAAALDHMTATGLIPLGVSDELRRALHGAGPGLEHAPALAGGRA